MSHMTDIELMLQFFPESYYYVCRNYFSDLTLKISNVCWH
jgi:hypothetical protein